MDVNEDIVYVAPPSVSAPKPRYPVARMHASRVVRAKDAKKKNDVRTRSHPQPQRSLVSESPRSPDWSVKYMRGDCAPYNDHACWVYDSSAGKVYMIGGRRPSDEHTPTSDFYCYDTKSMKWEDLTESFVYRRPDESYYSATNLNRVKTPLPALSHPGCTLCRIENTSFIFLFGGYDSKTDKASSKVIVVNLTEDTREWWFERLGEDPNPRIAPAVVAIQNKVHIFGGYREYEGDPQACYSYSIAEWRKGNPSPWHWEVRDLPYSGQIPRDFVIGQAVSVFGGKKILLTPGRLNHTDKRCLDFTEETLFYFVTDKKKRTFQKIIEPVGDPLPRDIGWYSIFEFKPPPPNHNPLPLALPVIPKKRGRPLQMKPSGSGQPRNAPITPQPLLVSQAPPNAAITNPVIICAWIPHPGTDIGFAPEIYRLSLTPDDSVDCLDVIQKVCDLKHDFQGFLAVDGRMHLLGSVSEEAGSMTSDSDSDGGPDATWNIYLDIPFDRLT